jgi:nucleotide-binding universal stress UspA family protein
MALLMILVNVAIIAMASIRITLQHAWGDLLHHILHPGNSPITAGTLLVGYADTWLAYSGLESGAQIAGAMKLPVRRTASAGMWLVIAATSFFSPILTAYSTFLLPEAVKASHKDAFISMLAETVGGQSLMVMTVVSAALLLIMACNTAIVGNYHVNLRLVSAGFLPPALSKRNLKFGTPHLSIALSAALPIIVVMATQGSVEQLGDLYSFGLLGTLVLSSLSLDTLRFREGSRGLGWGLGVFTTVALAVAWFINMVFKWHALAFGGTLSALIVGAALAYRSGWLGRLSPILAYRSVVVPISAEQVEALAAEKPKAARVLTVDEAMALQPLESAKILVALRGHNERLLRDAALLARGLEQANLYVVYVDEVPGLFFQPVEGPSDEANQVLAEASAFLSKLDLNAIPLWRLSNDAASGVADASIKLGAEVVMVGTSKRSAIWHLLRGHVVKGLAEALPEQTRLLICN